MSSSDLKQNEARRAVRGELEVNMSRLASRAAQKHCVENRMEEIQALLDKAASNPSITTPGWVGRPQYWSMQTVRWDAIAQSARCRRFCLPTTLPDYGALYSWMSIINGVMTTEQADWARLRTLEHMSRLTPEMIFELNATLQDARYLNWRIRRWMMQMEPTEVRLRLRKIRNVLPATTIGVHPDDDAAQRGASYPTPHLWGGTVRRLRLGSAFQPFLPLPLEIRIDPLRTLALWVLTDSNWQDV